ncbi:alpha/beta hydrolase [Aspergillus undulatus]|uniref:alpha/beta hydrolase n=1 Tax=Aspergillus undulatus TaxID=1810928 RepID=UPI003CCE2BE4
MASDSKVVVRSALTPVGSIQDLNLGDFDVRIFTPESKRSSTGWPVFVWFYGGGWAIGGINDGNDLCSLVCATAECVVVTVGYRLAPAHPYPTAVEDAVSALQWVVSPSGSEKLGGVDKTRIAVGGTSAGGNLAAVLSMKASQLNPPIPICFQLLVVPVIDNTASVSGIWAENEHAPWLNPARMEWYRAMYLPNRKDREWWDASPNLAPSMLLRTFPRTFIAIAGQDLLAPDARSFAKQLEGAWEGEGSWRSWC